MKIISLFYKHVILFVLIFVTFSYTLKYFFHQQEENYLNVQTELLQTQYETQYKYLKIMSHDIYMMYQENSKLISIFAQAEDANLSKRATLRQEMYAMLQKRYKRLVNMGVKQLHFHLKDNTSFLRMHAPEKFGDNLTKIRQTVALTNATLKENQGFEVGKIANGFRYVYPLFDSKKNHIGSMEVSFSSKQLIEYISDKFIINKHLLILESEINQNMDSEYSKNIYTKSLENSNYLAEKGSYANFDNDEFHKAMQELQQNNVVKENISKGIAFSTSSVYNYNSLVITYIPINSTLTNTNIAYIVFYTESDYIDSILIEDEYAQILLISLLIVLFFFSIYVTLTQRRLEQMAHYDKLTQLPNRAYFYIELGQEIKRASRFKKKLALMFIDLDGFKNINDSYGHHAGDEILMQTAQRLNRSIRNMDIAARIGGDEFIVLLTDVKKEEDVTAVAQKIIDNLNIEFKVSKQKLHIGASIGISMFPEDSNNLDTFISNADEAMYRAKESGKNKFVLYKEK